MRASVPATCWPRPAPAAIPSASGQARREAPTVADGLDRFFGEFVPRRVADGRMAAGTVREYQKQARLTVGPALGPMKIEAVTRADVERAVAKRGPVQRKPDDRLRIPAVQCL